MKIGNIVDWEVERSVGANVERGNNGGVKIDVDSEVGINGGEVDELKVVNKVGYGDGINVYKIENVSRVELLCGFVIV